MVRYFVTIMDENHSIDTNEVLKDFAKGNVILQVHCYELNILRSILDKITSNNLSWHDFEYLTEDYCYSEKTPGVFYVIANLANDGDGIYFHARTYLTDDELYTKKLISVSNLGLQELVENDKSNIDIKTIENMLGIANLRQFIQNNDGSRITNNDLVYWILKRYYLDVLITRKDVKLTEQGCDLRIKPLLKVVIGDFTIEAEIHLTIRSLQLRIKINVKNKSIKIDSTTLLNINCKNLYSYYEKFVKQLTENCSKII